LFVLYLRVRVSFGWDSLKNLPRTNALAYFAPMDGCRGERYNTDVVKVAVKMTSEIKTLLFDFRLTALPSDADVADQVSNVIKPFTAVIYKKLECLSLASFSSLV
jgi:hypothetical protein